MNRLRGAPAVDRHGFVDHLILGLVPGLERCEIDEQFERRARLPLRLCRAIIVGRHIIGAANHRADGTIAVHRHQRTLRALGGIVADCGIGGALHSEVERCPHFQRTLRLVDQQFQLRQRPIGKVAHAVLARLGHEGDLVDLRVGSLGGGDRPGLLHQLEHNASAPAGGIDVGGWRVIGRCLDQPRDHCRFGQAQPFGTVTEEFARGRVDAIGTATEIDLVEIQFEDLVLAELSLQREGENALADLSTEFLAGIEEKCYGRAVA